MKDVGRDSGCVHAGDLVFGVYIKVFVIRKTHKRRYTKLTSAISARSQHPDGGPCGGLE